MLNSKWRKYYLDDFCLAKNNQPYLYASLKTTKGLEPTKKPIFFPSKVKDGYVYIHDDAIKKLFNENSEYNIQLPIEIKGEIK